MGPCPMIEKLHGIIQILDMLAKKAMHHKSSCQNVSTSINLLKAPLDELQQCRDELTSDELSILNQLESACVKLKELLESCSGRSSKLILVQEYISSLESLDFSADIDTHLVEQVEHAVMEIKSGIKLSHRNLAMLAGKLGFHSNQGILKEASILEKEKTVAHTNRKKNEEELFSLLIVLVTQISDDMLEQKQLQAEDEGISIPADFRCPLSLELMSDPVIVASGQTYERAYIQQWLDEGNTTCPKSRQTLTNLNLFSNYTVKALIESWCEQNGVPLVEPSKRLLSPSRTSPVHIDIVVQGSTEDAVALLSGGHASHLSQNSTNAKYPGSISSDHAFEARAEMRPEPECSSGENSRNVTASLDQNLLKSNHGSNIYADSGASKERESNFSNNLSRYSSDASGELSRLSFSGRSDSTHVQDSQAQPEFGSPTEEEPAQNAGLEELNRPLHIDTPPEVNGDDIQLIVGDLVRDLQSPSCEVQRNAAAELRFHSKCSVENRIVIADSGAIPPLISLLHSTDPETQAHAVTALLNLSINNNNKSEIAAANAIGPLVHVLHVGTPEAKENAAATLYSLSVMGENNIAIGQSGAIEPLVDLLTHGTLRGKKDAVTALFNLSIRRENKIRIVQANAIPPLVRLMSDPAAGMVDKTVAVISNLSTIPEGRDAIGQEEGIPVLVEVIETGSPRGKENAAAALYQLCSNSSRFKAMVIQEGAIPPLAALTRTGTPRAKEKATSLLRLFREQRHGR
ncbi:hypothetical protein KP509_27G022700 [Ceratopteris richardii]|uniref:U-box domain-containing protein 12 n=1 Tax=Ceratopteris richardii TaxID=49495 RepID=A0A8T2RGL8_CERRI|nr:hypothetical protein KP509_27G022700 [Ceratopteris richardii]